MSGEQDDFHKAHGAPALLAGRAVGLARAAGPVDGGPSEDRMRDMSAVEMSAAAFAEARRAMVDCQVRPSDVTRTELIDAMLWAPREAFLPKPRRAMAYVGEHIALDGGRFELDPRVFAKMIDAADPASDELALVVGGGHGYAAAVLSKLCAAVVLLESDPVMAKSAADALPAHGVDTAFVVEGTLVDGAPGHAPYNLIVINGASEIDPPQALTSQLAEGGRLALIRVDGPVGRCEIGVKSGGVVGFRTAFDATAAVLPGFEAKESFEF